MAKRKKPSRHLELGTPVAAIESSTFMYEVRRGRWVGEDDAASSDCAVIVQERRKGRLGQCRVFRMVIDEAAVGTVVEGLLKWLGWELTCECCGDPASEGHLVPSQTESELRKGCGSGPDHPSVNLSERSELPTDDWVGRRPGLRTGSRDS